MVHLNHCASLVTQLKQLRKLVGIDECTPHRKKFSLSLVERRVWFTRERVPDRRYGKSTPRMIRGGWTWGELLRGERA